jgi:hypothetical protein
LPHKAVTALNEVLYLAVCGHSSSRSEKFVSPGLVLPWRPDARRVLVQRLQQYHAKRCVFAHGADARGLLDFPRDAVQQVDSGHSHAGEDAIRHEAALSFIDRLSVTIYETIYIIYYEYKLWLLAASETQVRLMFEHIMQMDRSRGPHSRMDGRSGLTRGGYGFIVDMVLGLIGSMVGGAI